MAGGASNATKHLAKLKACLAELGVFVTKEAIRVVGEDSFALASEGLARGENPGGREWAPRKADGAKPLRSLVGTLRISYGIMSFQIIDAKPYAVYHQKGAKSRSKPNWRLPVRRILPKKAMPKKWAEHINVQLLSKVRGLTAKVSKGTIIGKVKV